MGYRGVKAAVSVIANCGGSGDGGAGGGCDNGGVLRGGVDIIDGDDGTREDEEGRGTTELEKAKTLEGATKWERSGFAAGGI
jgi:hypothetical protein